MKMEMKKAFKSETGRRQILDYYDYLFELSNSGFERFSIETSFGSTYITVAGDKVLPPLILLHGSAMNSVMWINDMKTYSKKHRVFAIDIPGEAGRSNENQLPLMGNFYADWLKEVLDILSIEKTTIIGLSLGGWLAAKFSVTYSDMVTKLVLLCPAGIGPQKKLFPFKTLFYMLLGEKGMELIYKKVNGDQPMPKEVLEFQKLIGKHYNYRRELVPLFSDSELMKLNMPTILYVGGRDIMFHSDKTAKRLGELVPHAKINLLPDAGHALVNLVNQIMEQI